MERTLRYQFMQTSGTVFAFGKGFVGKSLKGFFDFSALCASILVYWHTIKPPDIRTKRPYKLSSKYSKSRRIVKKIGLFYDRKWIYWGFRSSSMGRRHFSYNLNTSEIPGIWTILSMSWVVSCTRFSSAIVSWWVAVKFCRNLQNLTIWTNSWVMM